MELNGIEWKMIELFMETELQSWQRDNVGKVSKSQGD